MNSDLNIGAAIPDTEYRVWVSPSKTRVIIENGKHECLWSATLSRDAWLCEDYHPGNNTPYNRYAIALHMISEEIGKLVYG